MGLQRTPPPGKAPIARQDATGSNEQADTSLPSPSQAFAPRNPRVMRSPQSGSSLAASTSSRPIAPSSVPSESIPQAQEVPLPITPAPTYHLAPVEEADISTTPQTAPPTTIADPIPPPDQEPASLPPVEESSRREAPTPEPVTPAPKRRKSRHHSEAPPVAINASISVPADTNMEIDEDAPNQFEKNAMYGKRYKLMMDTLEFAVKKSSHGMTLGEFTKCFPLFAAENRESFENTFERTRMDVKDGLWADATATLEANSFGPALKKIEDAVQEAKDNATEYGRPSAWRPELSAKAICAAANLPVYDQTYARLRSEYLEDCSNRYKSIAAKQALLKQLESTVSDGVVDLDKTIEVMQDFPTEEMRRWMEDVTPSLENSRTA